MLVKAAKKAIYAVVGDRDVTDEELITVSTGVESLLNSRPLTYQSSDPRDDVPLTPNNFLQGQMGGQFPPESVPTTTFHPRQRWRRFRTLFHEFGEDGLRNVFLHLTGDQSRLKKSKPLYKHIRVLLCKKRLQKTANIRKMRAF